MTKDIYDILAGKGRNGDTELAHITKEESNILKMLGGSGTTNPWTGLPEYHTGWKHIGSGHNAVHWLHSLGQGPDPHKKDSGLLLGAASEKDLDPTQEELRQQEWEERERKGGDPYDEDLGYESGIRWNPKFGNYNVNMTSEIWNNMPEDQKVDYVAMVEFGGNIPPEYDTIYEFETFIKDKLKRYAPVKGDIDPTKAGFYAEEYGGAGPDGIMGTEDDVSFSESIAGSEAGSTWDAAKYGLQAETGKIGSMLRSGYTGSGVGIRGSIGAQNLIGQGFSTGLDAYKLSEDKADLAYREGMYGLEAAPESAWQTNWQNFLGGLSEPL